MAAPFTRASLVKGPAQITFNSVTMFTKDDILIRIDPVWEAVMTSMYGQVDSSLKDRVYKVGLKLWGAWENLSTIFPSAILNPVVGNSLSAGSDLTLTIWARNQDKIVFTNAILTKVANLHLGIDGDLFSAEVQFTCIIGTGNNPEDVNAYYTISTAALTENAFAKTNLKKGRWTAAWGALTGFTSFVGQKGFDISWNTEVHPVTVDGYGTRDLTLAGFQGEAKAIPVVPTMAQLEAQAAGQGIALGALLSGVSADLTLTAGSSSVVLKNAGIISHGYAFGVDPLRLGEVTWRTTRGFAAGGAAALATVA